MSSGVAVYIRPMWKQCRNEEYISRAERGHKVRGRWAPASWWKPPLLNGARAVTEEHQDEILPVPFHILLDPAGGVPTMVCITYCTYRPIYKSNPSYPNVLRDIERCLVENLQDDQYYLRHLLYNGISYSHDVRFSFFIIIDRTPATVAGQPWIESTWMPSSG